MRGKIIELKQTSGGCPVQYEGKLETGQSIFVRERGGEVRIELDGIVVNNMRGEALDCLCSLFELGCEIEYR